MGQPEDPLIANVSCTTFAVVRLRQLGLPRAPDGVSPSECSPRSQGPGDLVERSGPKRGQNDKKIDIQPPQTHFQPNIPPTSIEGTAITDRVVHLGGLWLIRRPKSSFLPPFGLFWAWVLGGHGQDGGGGPNLTHKYPFCLVTVPKRAVTERVWPLSGAGSSCKEGLWGPKPVRRP